MAMVGDTIYLNLCNENREVVQISPQGWDVISNSPVSFIVPKTMQPLVRPEKGGRIDELKRFINIGSDEQWILMVSWLVKAFIPSGAYPILTIQGEQGSSKSTTAKILKSLIDPATAPLRNPPRSSHDLFISAEKAWVLAYDNLSGMQPWLSDALCTLSTGGGFIVRELFTDSEEVVFDVMRPIILNGIEDLATRNDLADRSVIMYLPAIPKEKRRQESLIWSELDRAKPLILGALLDAVSTGLRNFHNITVPALPRMADYAHWIVAAESALPWEKGKYLEAYERNRREALAACLEVDIVATVICNFMHSQASWEGTATELLKALKESDPQETVNNRSFPKIASTLSNRLRRIAPSLRGEGIDFTQVIRRGKKFVKLVKK